MTTWINPSTVSSAWNDYNNGALLQETGDYLLLENGGRILLEFNLPPLWGIPTNNNNNPWTPITTSSNPWS